MEESKRAANYRERAQALGQAAKSLPPDEQNTALRHQKALQDLADIEDWIAVAPRPAGTKHDYNLVPRVSNDLARKVFRPRGRMAKRREPGLTAPACDTDPGHVASAPNCSSCNFAMTLISRDGMANVRLPPGPLFECRSCGIMVAPE